jgi:hypothetical protein
MKIDVRLGLAANYILNMPIIIISKPCNRPWRPGGTLPRKWAHKYH